MSRGLLALGFGSVVLLGATAAITGDSRTYASSNFMVQIDGATQIVKSVEGGSAFAPAVTRGARKDGWADKQNGPVHYSDAVLMVPVASAKPLWDWMNAFSSPAARTAKDVTILGVDYSFNEKSRRLLSGTRISKIELPACDGSSKEPGYLALTLTPGFVRESAGSGSRAAGGQIGSERAWTASNFTLSIEGVDTTRVSKIDKITIRRGDSGPPEYSDIDVSVAEASGASWKQWAAASQSGKSVEKNGRIDLLDSARKPFLRIALEGLGIVSVSPQKAEANVDTVQRLTARMYVEKMTFTAL